MKAIRSYKLKGERFLGSVIEIEIVFDEAPSAATITIRDPYDTIVVEDANMTQVSTTPVYSYVYQQADGNNSGEFLAVISATFSANTLKFPITFTIEDPDPAEST